MSGNQKNSKLSQVVANWDFRNNLVANSGLGNNLVANSGLGDIWEFEKEDSRIKNSVINILKSNFRNFFLKSLIDSETVTLIK